MFDGDSSITKRVFPRQEMKQGNTPSFTSGHPELHTNLSNPEVNDRMEINYFRE
jgi:hypothetical protein